MHIGVYTCLHLCVCSCVLYLNAYLTTINHSEFDNRPFSNNILPTKFQFAKINLLHISNGKPVIVYIMLRKR